jgi:CDP-glycerol glycerophosphotransferase (TagB/SpsB family)
MRIIVFGTGQCAKAVLAARKRRVEVVAASDNNAKVWGQRLAGAPIIAPADILTLQHDYLIVCSAWAGQIVPALVESGIPRERIVSCYQFENDDARRVKELSILGSIVDLSAPELPAQIRRVPAWPSARAWRRVPSSWRQLWTRVRDGRTWYRVFLWLPIDRRIAFFDSYWGNGYSCNPGAITEYLSTVSDGRPWTLVWGLNNPSSVETPPSVVKVKRLGIAYHYYAARAGLLVSNVNFPDHIEKRRDTLHIQTMHGTPIKTLGLDIPGEFPTGRARAAFLRRCERWDYLTAPGQYTADVARRAFRFTGPILTIGYPRNDYLFSGNTSREIARLRGKLGIPQSRKAILFAPTWRPTGDDAVSETASAVLGCFANDPVLSEQYVLLVRFHHLMTNVPWPEGEPARGNMIDVSHHADNRELMLVADALITDYSSIVFDYALLDRPIALCCLDYERYATQTRGVYIDIVRESPWPVFQTAGDVTTHLREAISSVTDLAAHRRFVARFGESERGDACARLYKEVIRPWATGAGDLTQPSPLTEGES